MALAQLGYPNPKEYQDKEKLILDYTFATGGTHTVKSIIDYLEDQQNVATDIVKKHQVKEAHEI